MHYLTAVAFLIVTVAVARGAAPPGGVIPPAQGVVSAGHVWAMKSTFGAWAYAAPLAGGGKPVVVSCGPTDVIPARWHVSHGALWFALGYDVYGYPSYFNCSDSFSRLEAAELLRGRTATAPGGPVGDPPDPTTTGAQFGGVFPAKRIRMISRVKEDNGLHYDFLPTGPASALHFVLTEVKTPWGGDALLPWSMTVYSHTGKYDRKERGWVSAGKKEWEAVEAIDVGFVGPFRVMSLGKDYYFLTDGGSLFRSPPAAKKGERRRMERVYDGRDRPVLATVADADAGRTFLFIESAKGPAFFELSDRPALTVYDPKVARTSDGDEPLRSVMHKVRVLAALGKIKGK
jgi:hypothetical protein